MDIFLDQITSLHLTRTALRDTSLRLAETNKCVPEPPSAKPIRLNRLGLDGLLSYLRIPEDRYLGIVVPCAKDRVRTAGIRCTVDSGTSREGTYLQLVSANAKKPCALVPQHSNVFVQSPQKIVLSMAKTLAQRVHMQELTHEAALLRLVKLCLELCGTYAHDPFSPLSGDVAYGTTPPATAQLIREFLSVDGRERGLSLAREAAGLAYNLSGSPQESFMGPALFFPSRYGGLCLCDYKANEELELTPEERALINWRTITPDFQLVGYRAVVEYLGKVHEEDDNPRIDHVRSLDYQTLGRREFSFWYDDVKTIQAFNQSALRLVAAIEQVDGPKARAKFRRHMASQKFLEKQKGMFEVFRPWLR